LSLERIIRIIEAFGLKRIDAEVYVYLAKKGPLRAIEVATALKLSKQKLYHSLRNLRNKGVITADAEQPTFFSAMTFENALDLLVRANIEQAKAIKETKEELLSSWRSMKWQENT
jgi:sugar-specific transcriptional regulator TrmB